MGANPNPNPNPSPSPYQVRWIHAPWEFSTSKACRDQSRLVSGHELKPAKLQLCARSTCQGKGAATGKGTGCGPRRIRPPPPAGASWPKCVVQGQGFAARPRAHGREPDKGVKADYRDSGLCEFRFHGRSGSRWVGSWQ